MSDDEDVNHKTDCINCKLAAVLTELLETRSWEDVSIGVGGMLDDLVAGRLACEDVEIEQVWDDIFRGMNERADQQETAYGERTKH